MNFEEFTDYISDHITEGWQEDASVSIQKIKKNNGTVHTGVYIRREESMVTPAIYLESFYRRFKDGADLSDIIMDIREEYDWAMSRMSAFEFDISSFSCVKNRLIYRLVNYERNREVLTACPHIRLEDLAVTFRWLAHEDSVGISTALVTHREMELWDVSLEEILLYARENTERIFPGRIMPMDHFFQELNLGFHHIPQPFPLYIATNQQQINGASVILYENFLQDFVSEYPGDYYILPSSIHEVILAPADKISDPDTLYDIVAHANATVVKEGDFLSDSVYYYDSAKETITIYLQDR